MNTLPTRHLLHTLRVPVEGNPKFRVSKRLRTSGAPLTKQVVTDPRFNHSLRPSHGIV